MSTGGAEVELRWSTGGAEVELRRGEEMAKLREEPEKTHIHGPGPADVQSRFLTKRRRNME